MVMYDKFKIIFMQSNKKTSKKFLDLGQKSQYCPKIPEIDLDFFRLFRPKNKLSQFDHYRAARLLSTFPSDHRRETGFAVLPTKPGIPRQFDHKIIAKSW